MTWTADGDPHQHLSALLADLEMQADGLYLEERDREVEARADAGFAEITLAGRLHASLGRRVRAVLAEDSELVGVLRRCGAGWFLLESGAAAWLVPVPAVVLLDGLADRSVPLAALPVAARLSVRSALRTLAAEGPRCVLRLRGGRQVDGSVRRVGADFVVLGVAGGDVTVPLAGLVAVGVTR